MEIPRLRSFIALAEELNFQRAAKKLHLTQSPLSAQIKKLENELGVRLFNRNTRKVELTHAGRAFLEEALQIQAKADSAAQRAKDVASGRGGALALGYLTSMTNDRFSAIMSAYREECPEVELALNDLVPDATLSALRHREIDVGFLRAAFRDQELAAREIWRDTLMVALPKKHWLAGRGLISARNLADETFIMVPDKGSMGLNETIRALCLRSGFAPKKRIQANQLQSAVWLVHLGFGVSLVPASLQGLHRDNVVYQPLKGSPVLPAYMVWRKDNASPALGRFREIVQRTLRTER